LKIFKDGAVGFADARLANASFHRQGALARIQQPRPSAVARRELVAPDGKIDSTENVIGIRTSKSDVRGNFIFSCDAK
jgi:hypothetical protein